MSRRTLLVASLSVALLTPAAFASAPTPIVIGERFELSSKVMKEDRTVLVSTPDGYANGTQRYPVLVLTDGDAHLVHTRGTVSFLARQGLMPEMIIVGLPNTDRTRDLTPTRAALPQIDGPPRDFPTSGGADRFLDFIEKELLPWVDASYRTQPYRVLAGHSFGGLFALHAAFSRPDLFGAVIAASPTLIWDEELPLREARTLFAKRGALPRTVFFSMANEEDGAPSPTPSERLSTFLGGVTADGFAWKFVPMPDETHGSVVMRSHYWGLKTVFSGWRLPRDPATGLVSDTLAAVRKHFSALSRRYGYPIEPGETLINQLGYTALARAHRANAIELFRFNVERFPESANVHDSLGEALEQEGRLEEALASYTRAYQLGRATDHAFTDVFRANMERAAAAVEVRKAR